MTESFDIAAKSYDKSFTNTEIGKRQRNIVRAYLNDFLSSNNIKNILEINCGTGEDAIWFAKQNIEIFATDISPEMIKVAQKKVDNSLNNLSFGTLDINTIDKANHQTDYDLVFSNFGGLNCLTEIELKLFFKNVKKILKPNASLILVIMPKLTFIEKIYRILKKEKNIFEERKNSTGVEINVDEVNVKTYFYSVNDIKKFSKKLNFVNAIPTGFFPSYFENKFKKFKLLSTVFFMLENIFLKFKNLSNYADHYLIHLKLK